jgi:hypothetical protein
VSLIWPPSGHARALGGCRVHIGGRSDLDNEEARYEIGIDNKEACYPEVRADFIANTFLTTHNGDVCGVFVLVSF